jgi:hypothetical protein
MRVKAQQVFDQQKPALEREAKEARKRNAYDWRQEARGIEDENWIHDSDMEAR